MQKSEARTFDFLSVFLLASTVLLAAARLVATDWLPNLTLIAAITRWGLFFGFAFNYSRFKKWGISLLSLGYSIFFFPLLIYRKISPDLATEARLLEMGNRFESAFNAFGAQKPVNDPLIALSLLGLLFWLTALYAVFALLRHKNGLAALLPTTLISLIVQYYDAQVESKLWMVGLYFFFALLLLARLNYIEKSHRWEKQRLFLIPDAKLDISIFSTLAIAVLLLFSWNLPASAKDFNAISEWWDRSAENFERTRRNLDNLLSSIDNALEDESQSIYGSSMALGNSAIQSTNPIALITPPLDVERPPRYYWRIRSYDTYLNGTWQSAPGNRPERMNAGSPLLSIAPHENLGTFTFTNKTTQMRDLLRPAETYWIDLDTYANYMEPPADARDLNLLRAVNGVRGNGTYLVKAAPLTPTVVELRAAGTDYPDWVRERYLQLPVDLSAKIPALAREVVGVSETPYEKALLITSYLRREIAYSANLPTPPKDSDPLEWFLFDLREGYCNYFASAEVLMLRSLDIPARLAVGFAEGAKTEDGQYLVLEKDAHAWVEVYFPTIGWVEFEPTANQGFLGRPQGEVIDINEIAQTPAEEEDNERRDEKELPIPLPQERDELEAFLNPEDEQKVRPTALFWGMIVLITVVVLFGIWQLNRKQAYLRRVLRFFIRLYEERQQRVPRWLRNWVAWLDANSMERAFSAINFSLYWLDGAIPHELTPRERAQKLIGILPLEEDAILTLTAEHEKTLFSPTAGDLKTAQSAGKRIWRAALKRKL